jgi:hypothetical protein
MATRDRKLPLMRYLTKKLGVRRGYMCMAFIIAWGTAQSAWEQEHPGEVFNVTRYYEWWKISESTAMREQRLFREAFSQYATPADLLDEVGRQKVGSVQELRWSL